MFIGRGGQRIGGPATAEATARLSGLPIKTKRENKVGEDAGRALTGFHFLLLG